MVGADKDSGRNNGKSPDEKTKGHHIHMPKKAEDGHYHILDKAKGNHHFHLIYSVKPSFFNFLNKLSKPVRSSLKLLIALAGFLIFAMLPLDLAYDAQM